MGQNFRGGAWAFFVHEHTVSFWVVVLGRRWGFLIDSPGDSSGAAFGLFEMIGITTWDGDWGLYKIASMVEGFGSESRGGDRASD